MAKAKIIKLDSFKRGDTPVFTFTFSPPSASYDWSGTTADFAMTNVAAPTTNAGAALLRTALSLTTDADNNASISVKPNTTESGAFIPGTEYTIEVQLKDTGGANVATAVTAIVTVEQDYVI